MDITCNQVLAGPQFFINLGARKGCVIISQIIPFVYSAIFMLAKAPACVS